MQKKWNSLDHIKAVAYDQITTKLPISFDAVVMFLYNKNFRKTYNFLKKSQKWSQEQIKSYQEEKLSELLNHSYKNVPYYTKLFDKIDLKPDDVNSLEDLQKIPFLTKDNVRENVESLKSINYPNYTFRHLTTGGSTGTPLGFYVTKGVWDAEELAYGKIIFDRFGCSFKDKYVLLRGYLSKYKDETKFWESSLFGRCLILLPNYMSEENLPKYVKRIRKFKPKFIITFPSIISILAGFMKKNNLPPFPTVKVISCTSELLYDWQKELLQDFFKCDILCTYGHAESAVLAATCKKSQYYHFFPEYGIIELIDEDGKPINKEGKRGEIVATGLRNFIFPFIRYKTGDIGVYTTKKCECGSSYTILAKIEGRCQDFVISKTNKILPSTAGFHGLIAKSAQNVVKSQMHQEKIGEIIFKIVKGKNYSNEDEKQIRTNFKEKFGDEFDLIINYVDDIKSGRWGRHKFFIQNLPISIENILKN